MEAFQAPGVVSVRDTLLDCLLFKLGEYDTDIQHGPAHRGRGVELFCGGNKFHIIFLKQLHHVRKVQNGAAYSVQLIDNYPAYLAFAYLAKELLKLGPVRVLTGIALVFENPATASLQLILAEIDLALNADTVLAVYGLSSNIEGIYYAITKIHAVKVRLGDAINYIENPDKTDGQELISGYNTAPQTAVLDFSITAAMARKARNTSAKKQGNLAYHLIQSFSPDDAVTPELAHKLGRKLAMEFTDGKFEFVVATHINKDSIHNHIIINAVSFYDYKKLRTVPYRTAQQIRSISDRLCMESQLSVIKDPQQLGQLYPTYIQKKRTASNRTEVRKKLNFCLERATNYAQFLQMAQDLGISVCQRGKHMTYLLDGAGRAIRDTSLADTDKFTYTGIMECLEDNAAEQQFIRERMAKIFPSVSTFTDFIKQLQSESVKARIKKQTGQLLYKAADLDGT